MTKDELIDCPACDLARRHDPEGMMRGPCGICGDTGKVRRGEWSEHMPDWDGRGGFAPTADADDDAEVGP